MTFEVIGTDHRFQQRDVGLHHLLESFFELQYFAGPIQLIAEESDNRWGNSVARNIAVEHHIEWLSVDMTPEEKAAAGIAEEQPARRESGRQVRVPSDDIREQAWVEKLEASGKEHILVVCGYLHLEGLVQKLKIRGHETAQRVYLETVPDINQ
jgi:hypothetical protein